MELNLKKTSKKSYWPNKKKKAFYNARFRFFFFFFFFLKRTPGGRFTNVVGLFLRKKRQKTPLRVV
ncbi:hypothetical protein Hanom_Chr02g00172711 [Helianthus anomalus]